MRIAIFTDTFLPQINGVTNTLQRLGEYLMEHAIEYIFITPEQKSESDIPYNVESFLSAPFFLYPECRVTFPNLIRLTKKLDNFRPDIIFLMTEFTMGLCGLTYGKKNKIPVVSNYSTHFNQILKSYKLGAFEKILDKYITWFHQEADLTTTPSEDSRACLIEMGVEPVYIFSRGIDSTRFSPIFRSQEIRKQLGIEHKIGLLYVGRISWEKDLDILCEAMHRLNENYRDRICLIMTGDGPCRAELIERLPDNTVFTGIKRNLELAQIYASSDIFVFPSSFETFGNVVVEAFASGLPVIGVNKGGVKDLIEHGVNGLLTEAKDPVSFTEAIECLINNEVLRYQLSHGSLKSAKQRSWDAVFYDLINQFKALSGEKEENSRKEPFSLYKIL